jgi:hypothetical protein
MHPGQQVEALDCRLEEGGIIAVNDRLDRGDAPMPREGRKARPDYRLAENAPVLLGHVASGAEPATGSDDNSGDLHCHVRQSQSTPCGATALSGPVPAANRGFVLHFPIFSPLGIFCSATLAHWARLAKLYAV